MKAVTNLFFGRVFSRGLVLLVVAWPVLTSGGSLQASRAEAYAHVFFADVVGPDDDDVGEISASANAFDVAAGAAATGRASVDISQQLVIIDITHGYEAKIPNLHAYATGISNGDHTVGGQAYAEASFTDVLKPDSPLLQEPAFSILNPYIYFITSFKGSISDTNSADLSLTVFTTDSDDQTLAYRSSESFTGPGSVDKKVILRVPANIFSSGNTVNYSLDLSVGGGSVFGDNSEFISDGTADFSHTASFEYYYFGDADGNRTPGNGQVNLVGDVGMYANQATSVPEPSCALLLFGSALSLRFRRRR